MKVYFDVHGALTVEGEDATEWLALRTWTARWSDSSGPLIVKWKTERMTQQAGDEKPWPMIETDSRQLFRVMTETPNKENRLLRELLREWHGMFVHCRRDGTEGADLIDRTGAMLMLADAMTPNARANARP